MAKILEKGTKVKVRETIGSMLASMSGVGYFEIGEIGTIKEFNTQLDGVDWYKVEFKKGENLMPDKWLDVVDELKEEELQDAIDKAQKAVRECLDIIGACDGDCDADIELPENHGDIVTIQYNGDSLEITVTTEDGDIIEMEDPTDKEVDITFSLVNALYNVLGIGVKYPYD